MVGRALVHRRRSCLNRKRVSPPRRERGVRWFVGVGVIATALVIARTALSRRTQTSTPIDFGMALIPAGYYSIGVDVGAANVRPAHRVRLAAFGLEKREATVADFRAFAVATHAPTPWAGEPPANNHDHPVTACIGPRQRTTALGDIREAVVFRPRKSGKQLRGVLQVGHIPGDMSSSWVVPTLFRRIGRNLWQPAVFRTVPPRPGFRI